MCLGRRMWSSVGGVMVSIVAFQAMDPGSIPGRRTLFFDTFLQRLRVLFTFFELVTTNYIIN